MDFKEEIQMAMLDERDRNSPRPGRIQGGGGGGAAPPQREDAPFVKRRIRQLEEERRYRRGIGEDVEGEDYAPLRNQLQEYRGKLKALGDD